MAQASLRSLRELRLGKPISIYHLSIYRREARARIVRGHQARNRLR